MPPPASENPRADFPGSGPYRTADHPAGKRYQRWCDWCRKPFQTNRANQHACSEACRRAFEARIRQLTLPLIQGYRAFMREQGAKERGGE